MAANPDGSIVIKTELDNKQTEKELANLGKKIERLEDQIYTKKQQQLPLVKQAEELEISLERARQKLAGMEAGTISADASGIREQQAIVRELQSEYNAVQRKVMGYDDAIEKAAIELDIQKERAGELVQELDQAAGKTDKMAAAQERASKSAKKFSSRLKSVVRSALIFTVITRALSSFRDWLGKVVKTNDEATAAIAGLKGALLTLAQPLVEVIIPAFTLLVNILTKVVSAIAQVVSMLFGKTISQSKEAAKNLNAEAEALEGVGSAAEDAAGSLAGFDEINAINTETAGSGGGGTTEIQPDFNFDADLTEGALQKILELVKLIGAALLTWKIASALGLGLKNAIGLFLALYSVMTFVQGLLDAWNNGISWKNFAQMLGGMLGTALGLGAAFGPVAAGISLVVTGLAMLVTGFHDAIENGLNLQNMLTMVAGLLGAGIGIGILTGSWIPALIAGLAAGLLAITYFFGDGEALIAALQQIFEGFSEFFSAIFAGDMEAAGEALKKIWEGIKKSALIIWDALKKAFKAFGEWFLKWGSQKLWDFWQWCENWGDDIRQWWDDLWAGVKKAWDDFWAAIGKKIDGLVDLGKSIIDNIKKGISDAWNGLVTWFNNLWDSLFGNRNAEVTVTKKTATSSGGINTRAALPSAASYTLPRLATGAVIPPNREFMAVLGDNKTETEVVSPLSTMKQAVLEALREAGGTGGDINITVELDGKAVARNTVRHINSMTEQAGRPVLLI